MAPSHLVSATANPDKVAEIAAILGDSLLVEPRPDWVPDVVEDADTLVGNARLKASTVAFATGRPAMADDTGLEVDALDGAPGVRTARFAGERATAQENIAHLLAELERVGATDAAQRTARFRTVVLVRWPDGREVRADGVVEGTIIDVPTGSGGFGYDPVFAPDEARGRTFAEMAPAAKHAVSHRGRAVRAMAAELARPLVIVGAGGHAREVLDIVEAVNADRPTFRVVGVVADGGRHDEAALARRGVELLGEVELLRDLEVEVVIAVGSSPARAGIDERLRAWGRTSPALVHPSATVGADVELGPGVILAAGARVTTNVRLGRHTHVNVNAVISHDGRLGDHVTVSPGALVNGNVTIDDRAFLGTGAVVTPGRHIGSDAVIGAGAVVVDDVPAGVTARGVPAAW